MTTSISLAEHPLTLQLQNCRSGESVITLLQDQIRASSDFVETDRLKRSVTSIISILPSLSATAAFDWALDLVRRGDGMFHISDSSLQTFSPENAILASIAILLAVCAFPYLRRTYRCDVQVYQATKGIDSGYDALVDLFESVARFFRRLAIYTQIPHTTALDDVLTRILMELLSTFAQATEVLEHGRSSKSILVDVLKLLNGMQRS